MPQPPGLAWVALVLIASTALGQTWTRRTATGPRRHLSRRRFLAQADATAQGTDGPTSPEDLPQPAPPADETASATPTQSTGCPAGCPGQPPNDVLLKGSVFEKWGQDIEQWKSQWPLSVTFGAYNWWHVDNGGPIPSGYGISGVPGTHSYYLFAIRKKPVDWGNITKIGAHVQMRFRDSGVPFAHSIPKPTSGSGRHMATSTRRWDD